MTTTRRISCRASTEPLESRWLGTVEYLDAWERQRAAAAARADGSGPDTVLLLEHPSVYTAGRRTRPHERPTDGTPVIDVDRGGLLTWHGPGQLVGYPIVRLGEPIDVVDYVRRLEEALIAVVAGLGVPCGRVAGRSGVWVGADDRGPERKIAAIGIRVVRGVTLHGFSLNCDPDLRAYDSIVPCGLTDVGVTSLAAETGHPVTVADVLPDVTEAVVAAIDGRLPVAEHVVPRAVAPAGLTLALDPALG